MERHGALIQVAVTDDGARGGVAPTVPCLGGGYGLRLVEELSQAWGWFGRSGGPLTVWAVVDPRAEEAHGSGTAEAAGDPGRSPDRSARWSGHVPWSGVTSQPH
ncbi:hypothetical protein BJF83_18535 [Nocardiopsis sp. CNR-923]|nr:hypothetical protein BJF83_18535 [Nocardiopsis sp. CNR-923]